MERVTYLLDTDTLIFMVRGLKATGAGKRKGDLRRQAARIIARCREAQREGHTVGLSAITLSELEFGARKSEDYETEIQAVMKVIAPFDTLDYRAVECSPHYGKLRHRLEEEGRPIGSTDLLIAAHALSLDAAIITSNVSHFSRIEGLTAENWAIEAGL